MTLIHLVARNGRWCLVAGLIAGLILPGVALSLRPWLPELVGALLFMAALRIGPQTALGELRDLGPALATALAYQLAAPLLALAVLWPLGLAATPAGLAVVLVLSAPSVTGNPHFAIMMGRDPAVAMRLLLVGTALFPLTVLPVLWASPAVETVTGALEGAARLIVVIFGTTAAAFALRWFVWPAPGEDGRKTLDALSAILLAVVVVGLMSAAGPALRETPLRFAGWLALAMAVNFGMQFLAFRLLPVANEARDRVGTSVVAGNRNIALFLVALPAATMEPLLLFIGCYQIPMYLTPIVMGKLMTGGRLLEHPGPSAGDSR